MLIPLYTFQTLEFVNKINTYIYNLLCLNLLLFKFTKLTSRFFLNAIYKNMFFSKIMSNSFCSVGFGKWQTKKEFVAFKTKVKFRTNSKLIVFFIFVTFDNLHFKVPKTSSLLGKNHNNFVYPKLILHNWIRAKAVSK